MSNRLRTLWAALLLGAMLPNLGLARPILHLSPAAGAIYWHVRDDQTGRLLQAGCYRPGAENEKIRPATLHTPTDAALAPEVLDAIRAQVRRQLATTEAETQAMPVLSGQYEVVVTPEAPADLATLPAYVRDYLGTTNVHTGESWEFIDHGPDAPCYVQECSLYPVPFADSFTLRFACSARADVRKDVRITAVALAEPGKVVPLYTGQFGKGVTTLPVDTHALPAGRYCVQVSIGRYTRTFDVLKQ